MSSSPLTIGMLAHVDAGKTTLIEALLYAAGAIRDFGRVDKGDGFLDTDQLERKRGITIYAQEARFTYQGQDLILLDTPGHADFAPEMERTLPVLDMAILVIDARDGLTAHTRLIWSLLRRYQIPTFFFINKMDLPGAQPAQLLTDLSQELGARLVDFGQAEEDRMEAIALGEDRLLAAYLDQGALTDAQVQAAIASGQIFPSFFGSALKGEGVQPLLDSLVRYRVEPQWPSTFAARVYKISHDDQRLVQARILGGHLDNKDSLGGEKIHQIRRYSGTSYQTVQRAEAGDLVSLLGPKNLQAGQAFGPLAPYKASLQPVLPYAVTTAGSFADLLQAFQALNEEFPELALQADPGAERLRVRVMGPVFLEILEDRLAQAGVMADFQAEAPLYLETLTAPALGLGHYEPKGHYAEVALLLEPSARNSGLTFVNDLAPDQVEEAQVRAVETALLEGQIPGVLTGAPLTDICFHLRGLLVSHHSHHADFQEAARRAVRQGLMSGQSCLLQPLSQLDLRMGLAESGRYLQDLDRLGVSEVESQLEGPEARISAKGPVTVLYPYLDDLQRRQGRQVRAQASWAGYGPVETEEAEALIQEKAYKPDQDPAFPPHSIFFQGGASFTVNWAEVWTYAHLKGVAGRGGRLGPAGAPGAGDLDGWEDVDGRGAGTARAGAGSAWGPAGAPGRRKGKGPSADEDLDAQEVERIFKSTFYANANWEKREASQIRRREEAERARRKQEKQAAREAAELAAGREPAQPQDLDHDSDPAGGGGDQRLGYDPAREQGKGVTDQKAAEPPEARPTAYLLVDGYNICHAWPGLKQLVDVDLDQARDLLLRLLQEYQALSGQEIILVFDAYKVRGREEMTKRGNVYVVYTQEAQTADRYIEQASLTLSKQSQVTVATSDGLEQLIVWKQGATILSARELYELLQTSRQETLSTYAKTAPEALALRLGDYLEDAYDSH